MITIKSFDELVKYNPTTIEFMDSDPVLLKATINGKIIEFNYPSKGYIDPKDNDLFIEDGELTRYDIHDVNDIMLKKLIPYTLSISERELYNTICKFGYLEELIFISSHYTYLSDLPRSLKIIKLAHKSFNDDLLFKNIEIYCAKCCHENSDYVRVSSMEEKYKKWTFDDYVNCVFCSLKKYTQCNKCGFDDWNIINMVSSLAFNKFNSKNQGQLKCFKMENGKEITFKNYINKNITKHQIMNCKLNCLKCNGKFKGNATMIFYDDVEKLSPKKIFWKNLIVFLISLLLISIFLLQEQKQGLQQEPQEIKEELQEGCLKCDFCNV